MEITDIVKQSIAILAGFVVLLYIVLSIYGVIRNHKRDKFNSFFLVPLLGAMMILVLLSLSILLYSQLDKIEGGNNEEGSFLALITLSLSLASIIPFIVTKSLTERDINSLVSKAVLDKQKSIYEQVDSYVDKATARIHMSDSDDSRLIGCLLMTKKNPDYMWSLSWLMRSLLFYKTFRLEQQKLGQERELDYFYITQCFTFMRYDLLKMLRFSKDDFDLKEYLSKYDEENEKTYTAGITPIDYTSTICRVQNHILGVHEAIDNNDFNINKRDLKELSNDLLLLLSWLIIQIDNYLQEQFNTASQFSYSQLHRVNLYEIHFKQEEKYIQKVGDFYKESGIDTRLANLKTMDLKKIYPYFEREE